MMDDRVKSILGKLKNKSKSSGIDYQLLLQLLCQEEFLRRLSFSEYKHEFVLKGGLYIYLLSELKSRPTVDMDFLIRNVSNNLDGLIERVIAIVGTKTDNEFIGFELLNAKQITLEKKYPGVSMQMIGKIGNTKTPVNIDFGFGDVVVPKPETRIMSAQLTGFDDVSVDTYSLESTISEKFDAIIQRFELTSRMKDFYDIWYIALNYDFDGKALSSAIYETLTNRGTRIENDSIDRVLRLKENEIVMTRWNAFCKKTNINLEFDESTKVIDVLLGPIVTKLLKGELNTGIWSSKEQKWVQ